VCQQTIDGRPIQVQAPVRDPADAAAVDGLLAHGVTDLYVNVAALARDWRDAPSAMALAAKQLKGQS
jgi:hypothetical protein